MIDVGTDGSCRGASTPEGWRGPGGWAWYVDDETFGSGEAVDATNNIMELIAVREALKALPGALRIYSDSQYVIGCLTEWGPQWKANEWRRKKNSRKPIKNLDLVKEIMELLDGREVEFVWQRGHVGHELNEMADGLAGLASARVKASS